MGMVSKDVFLLVHKHSDLEVCRLMGSWLKPGTAEFLLLLAPSTCINVLALWFGRGLMIKLKEFQYSGCWRGTRVGYRNTHQLQRAPCLPCSIVLNKTFSWSPCIHSELSRFTLKGWGKKGEKQHENILVIHQISAGQREGSVTSAKVALKFLQGNLGNCYNPRVRGIIDSELSEKWIMYCLAMWSPELVISFQY
jgi:hypothetical protein